MSVQPFFLKNATSLELHAALAPFGVSHQAWICPSLQRVSGNVDYDSADNYRIDYQPMPFDDKPMTPYRWTKAPWFVEKMDLHSNGQLIIFTDGSTQELKELVPKH